MSNKAVISLATGLEDPEKVMIAYLVAVGAQIAQAGDQPPPALVQELAALQARGRSLAILNLALVALAAFAMSTARYW